MLQEIKIANKLFKVELTVFGFFLEEVIWLHIFT